MRNPIDWDAQLGCRLKLRDLHVFFTVVDCGSMGKAAARLGVTAPTISEAVADLEHAIGMKLFDRSSQGVAPTIYGKALLKRGRVAFDELKQGLRDIEFLADPTVGELRIACDESISAATLPLIIHRFAERHPGVVVDVEGFEIGSYAQKLRDRALELVITRRGQPDPEHDPHHELNVEILFEDQIVIVAGKDTRWARRSKLDIAELAGERWILTAPGTRNYDAVAAAFRARGLAMPPLSVTTLSVDLRTTLLSTGPYIATFPLSVVQLHGERFGLKALPVSLPRRPWPVALLTLKNRTLGPLAERFIECAHAAAKPLVSARLSRKEQQVTRGSRHH
jgi:DNA-binding transcriptional LysR family regulator